jgi:hypothetical protein
VFELFRTLFFREAIFLPRFLSIKKEQLLHVFQEREHARQVFKGSKGEKLRKELVKESVAPTTGEEAESERAAVLKTRPVEEQKKIKVLCLFVFCVKSLKFWDFLNKINWNSWKLI